MRRARYSLLGGADQPSQDSEYRVPLGLSPHFKQRDPSLSMVQKLPLALVANCGMG